MSETRTPLTDSREYDTGLRAGDFSPHDKDMVVPADFARLLELKAAHFDALRSALREMYEQCDSLEDFKYSRDIPPQEAADNWADARYAARKALAAADEIGGNND